MASLHFLIQWTHRILSEYLRRHALLELAQGTRVHDQGCFRVREHIDEAGSYSQSLCIDHSCSDGPTQITDGGNAVGLNSNVGLYRWPTGAVINHAALDDDVE